MDVNVELAQSLLAGWIAGALAGLAGTAAVLIVLARRPVVARRLPLPHNLTVLGIVFANALMIGLTLIGLLFGVVHYRLGSGPLFVALVLGLFAAAAGLYVFVRGRVRSDEGPAVLLVVGLAAAAFGGVLPWLGSLDVD